MKATTVIAVMLILLIVAAALSILVVGVMGAYWFMTNFTIVYLILSALLAKPIYQTFTEKKKNPMTETLAIVGVLLWPISLMCGLVFLAYMFIGMSIMRSWH